MSDDKIPIPDQSIIERRFAFIENEILRTNIIIAFRYIVFLINLEQNTQLPGPIIYSLHKDMIVQIALIVESCVHYLLKSYLQSKRISDAVLQTDWKEDKCVIIEESDHGNRQICAIIRHKNTILLTKHTQFVVLNRICLRASLFNRSIFNSVEELREARNKIHLAGLESIDEIYEKDEVDLQFKNAQRVINHIEKKLNEL